LRDVACDLVTFARLGCESFAIDDADITARVFDNARIAERRRGDAYARPTDAEHAREIDLREREGTAGGMIGGAKQQARVTSAQQMKPVACRELRDGFEANFGVAERARAQ